MKDVKGAAINVDEFVDTLCINVVKKFRQLDEEGFSRDNQKKKYEGPTLHYQISQLLEFKDEQVKIWDVKLENVLHEGIFRSINNFGHAILETDQNEPKTIIDGRMRKSDTN